MIKLNPFKNKKMTFSYLILFYNNNNNKKLYLICL